MPRRRTRTGVGSQCATCAWRMPRRWPGRSSPAARQSSLGRKKSSRRLREFPRGRIAAARGRRIADAAGSTVAWRNQGRSATRERKSPARGRSAPSIRLRQPFARTGRAAKVEMRPFPSRRCRCRARRSASPHAGILVAPGADRPASRPTPGRPERNPYDACRPSAARPASTP